MIVRFCYAVYLQLLNQHNQEFDVSHQTLFHAEQGRGLGTRLSLGWPHIRSAIFPADNTHAHCAYASSAGFAIDAPCRKLSLRSV